MIFDVAAKLANISLLSTMTKWLTTLTYPVLLIYLYCFGFGLSAKDLASLGRPKFEKILLPIIKYFLIFSLVLLAPSCLSFWIQFSPSIATTIKTAVLASFPITALILLLAARYATVSVSKKPYANQEHNQEDAPDPNAVR